MSVMKKLIVICFIMLSKATFSQSNFINIDQTAFLIGMLEDNNGRNLNLTNPQEKCLINRFWDKKILSLFIDSLQQYVKDDFKEFEIEDDFLFKSLKSCKYAHYFNSYYKFKNLGIIPKAGGLEIYETFTGRLKIRKFKTYNQRMNFLMGSFIKNGEKLNPYLYQYSFKHSLSHFKATEVFLIRTHSIILEKTVDKYENKQEIIFKPTNELKQLLDKLPMLK